MADVIELQEAADRRRTAHEREMAQLSEYGAALKELADSLKDLADHVGTVFQRADLDGSRLSSHF